MAKVASSDWLAKASGHQDSPTQRQRNNSDQNVENQKKINSERVLAASNEIKREKIERKRRCKIHYIWKYGPVLVLILALAFTWLKGTPEGKKVEIALQRNVDDIKTDLDAWLDKQMELYAEMKESTRGRLSETLFKTLEGDSPAEIGWALELPENRYSKNKTRQYWDFYNSGISTADMMPTQFKDDIFIFIPGLFTQWYPGYMKDLIAAMKALELKTFFCDINTAGSQTENAHFLADAILTLTQNEPERKVIIMGHSKGALDAATAFVLHPEIIPKISAFIAFQAPWGGSVIANDILSAHHRRSVSSTFIEKVLNGNAHSLVGVMYAERKKWIQAHPFPLGAIPTISVATYETSFKSLLKAPIDYVKLRYNELSDGCVATKDSIIPGTTFVEIPGLDHFGPAYHGFPTCCQEHDPLRIQMVLLNLLVHR